MARSVKSYLGGQLNTLQRWNSSRFMRCGAFWYFNRKSLKYPDIAFNTRTAVRRTTGTPTFEVNGYFPAYCPKMDTNNDPLLTVAKGPQLQDSMNTVLKFTMACWVKYSHVAAHDSLFMTFGDGDYGSQYTMYDSDSSANKCSFITGGGGASRLVGSTTISDGNWHFLCCTANNALATKRRIYVDGKLDASDATGITTYASAGSLNLLSAVGFAGAQNATIFAAGVWWRELQPNEIRYLYRMPYIMANSAMMADNPNRLYPDLMPFINSW